MDSNSDDPVIIRATRRNYFVVGYWILLAILFYLISLRMPPPPPNLRIPRIRFEVLALFAIAFAAAWWFWLRTLKIAVSGGYFYYRNGFYRKKVLLSRIENIQDEYVPWEERLRRNIVPRVIITLKNGDGLKISQKHFSRDDLEKMFHALNKAGAWKRKAMRVESLWAYRAF